MDTYIIKDVYIVKLNKNVTRAHECAEKKSAKTGVDVVIRSMSVSGVDRVVNCLCSLLTCSLDWYLCFTC